MLRQRFYNIHSRQGGDKIEYNRGEQNGRRGVIPILMLKSNQINLDIFKKGGSHNEKV